MSNDKFAELDTAILGFIKAAPGTSRAALLADKRIRKLTCAHEHTLAGEKALIERRCSAMQKRGVLSFGWHAVEG